MPIVEPLLSNFTNADRYAGGGGGGKGVNSL